ncbi:MAG: PqqD family protein [Planctomycetes bacterium]|nr:PqqD family protein [Planctomycetota bacterium]
MKKFCREDSWLSSNSKDSVFLISKDNKSDNAYVIKGEASILLWNLLAKSAGEDELVSAISADFDGSDQEIRSNISDLLGTLIKEKIIRSTDSQERDKVPDNSSGITAKPKSKNKYQKIIIESYNLKTLAPEQVLILAGTAEGNTEQAERNACATCAVDC